MLLLIPLPQLNPLLRQLVGVVYTHATRPLPQRRFRAEDIALFLAGDGVKGLCTGATVQYLRSVTGELAVVELDELTLAP